LFNTQGNDGSQQSKKDKDAEVKKMLDETTRAHELLANSFNLESSKERRQNTIP
jgi:hypothetical protein